MRSAGTERMTRNETVLIGRRHGVADVRDGEMLRALQTPFGRRARGGRKVLVWIISIRFRSS